MNEKETLSCENGQIIFEQGITELIHEQFLFAESVYARLPISIEMYDTDGILRFINDHALKMYGVNDRSAVVGTVNLFSSPYMDDQLKARIQSGEENIMLEFEYDFNRINEDEYFTTHNKNSMIFEVQVISLWNKAGNIIGHVLLSNDKTSVKETEFRTEENKKNLEMAMEAANMSSWVYDVRKKTFSSLHGTSIVKEKMTLDDFLDILHPQDCEQLRLVFSQLINKEIENGQITLRFFDEAEKQYRHYESRMRLSAEHMGKLLIIGTQLDITERLQMVKKTQELMTKRELAMQVSNIIHWDFDVRTQKFESYHDPINDYANDKLLTIAEYIEVIHPDDRSTVYDAMQSMLSGKDVTINFTCRIQTKYDDSWQYCNILGVPFEKDEDGNYRITGRIKDMIIRGGENIYPREIEEFLYKLDGVKDVQVAGIPSKKYGEAVGAFIILQEGVTIQAEDVRDFCRNKISRYKIPKYIFFVDEFPMTGSGKIQKFRLKDLGLKLCKEQGIEII